MSDQEQQMSGDALIFLGEVHAPSILPLSLGALGGLVSFRVHPLRRTGGIQVGLPAHLSNPSGDTFPVIVRGWGWLTPVSTTLPSWQLGDFLVAIEGITLDQAKEMTQLRQEAHKNQPENSSTETNLAPRATQ